MCRGRAGTGCSLCTCTRRCLGCLHIPPCMLHRPAYALLSDDLPHLPLYSASTAAVISSVKTGGIVTDIGRGPERSRKCQRRPHVCSVSLVQRRMILLTGIVLSPGPGAAGLTIIVLTLTPSEGDSYSRRVEAQMSEPRPASILPPGIEHDFEPSRTITRGARARF
jgi:hypothetical protein